MTFDVDVAQVGARREAMLATSMPEVISETDYMFAHSSKSNKQCDVCVCV